MPDRIYQYFYCKATIFALFLSESENKRDKRMTKNADKIFDKKIKKIKDFKFNSSVADVFDDMVTRSVPFYDEIHFIIKDILNKTTFDNGLIYDLGCSTGTTIALMYSHLKTQKRFPSFIGVDNSAPMIKQCRQKLAQKQIKNYTLICKNIEQLDFLPSNLIVMNYTLQFVDPKIREMILKKIYSSLVPGGIFILSEKISCTNKKIDDLFIDLYYDFKKRNGYSELAIAQKREALENILIPLTPSKQMAMLKKAGFKKNDLLFKWYNFASFIGIK